MNEFRNFVVVQSEHGAKKYIYYTGNDIAIANEIMFDNKLFTISAVGIFLHYEDGVCMCVAMIGNDYIVYRSEKITDEWVVVDYMVEVEPDNPND